MSFGIDSLRGLKITVMGLGLHGGGLAAARFALSSGAEVTVTDLRDRETLRPSIEKLEGHPVRFVLGKHEDSDFAEADMVIKNPGVPGDSPFLRKAQMVETDISLFLRFTDVPILAVTGTKGKSTVVSALYEMVRRDWPDAKLGGNITVSPLTFIGYLHEKAPVVLELSSWQLADLRGKGLLRPKVCAITNIMFDHQNRYSRFVDYVDDKREIYADLGPEGTSVFFYDDDYGRRFGTESPGRSLYYSRTPLPDGVDGGWIASSGEGVYRFGDETGILVPKEVKIPGMHNRTNLLCAGLMAKAYGIDNKTIAQGSADFPGIPHRLEFAGRIKGTDFYNDSAATIPDAVLEGVKGFPRGCVLITGGTDKNLDFTPYEEIARLCPDIVLLAGSGTEKIIPILQKAGRRFTGPFTNFTDACAAAQTAAGFSPGKTVLFSPGCASFELFKNEFHRGDKFKEAVARLGEICV